MNANIKTKLDIERADLYVSPAGNDAWSGTSPTPNADRADGPLATLTRARDVIRALKGSSGIPEGGIVVEVLRGSYEMPRPLTLSAEDSGTETDPIVFRSRGESVLIGGKSLKGFALVKDPAVLERLDPAARHNVVQTDLAAQGITDLGGITAQGWGEGQPGLELFFKGRRMTIARWPNEGFVEIASIDVDGNTELKNRVTLSGQMRGSNEGRFVYEGDRPKRWLDEKDAWLHGHWFWDWADQRQKSNL